MTKEAPAKFRNSVTPAKTGIQYVLERLKFFIFIAFPRYALCSMRFAVLSGG
jgi:hypothetical protein